AEQERLVAVRQTLADERVELRSLETAQAEAAADRERAVAIRAEAAAADVAKSQRLLDNWVARRAETERVIRGLLADVEEVDEVSDQASLMEGPEILALPESSPEPEARPRRIA
ncbi:MAG: hypothetical protein AAGJ97_08040, partial [Planctomycetota bacterium]